MERTDYTALAVTNSTAGSTEKDPPEDPTRVACPICEAPASYHADAANWGEWRRCPRCTHEFVEPLELREDSRSLFDAAYRGHEKRSGMQDFAERVKQRELIKQQPSLAFWTPAFDDVLKWLKRRLQHGGEVLELGCGPGFFLHAMRNEGFTPVGLDVAQEVVELNRQDGFRVWHGPVEDVPAKWANPAAVVAFFMLHHVVDPLGLLRTVRQRWPHAPLALAQYGPAHTARDGYGGRSSPPRTLHRWNSKDLAVALDIAGYTPIVRELPSTGMEAGILDPVRALQKRLVAFPRAYRFGKRVKRRFAMRVARPLRQDAYTLLAFSEPTSG